MRQVKVLPAYYAIPDQSITAFGDLLIGLFSVFQTIWPVARPKGPGKSKLDKHRPEIEALLANGSTQKFIAKCCKLDEEARSQETEAVKSYGGVCTFEPLSPMIAHVVDVRKPFIPSKPLWPLTVPLSPGSRSRKILLEVNEQPVSHYKRQPVPH